MCGIIAWKNAFSTVEGSQAQKALELIAHRGPDGLKHFSHSPTGTFLGHARLSIIDLETGDQPMSDDATGCVIIFNGEIYNYPELREELMARGHRFKTKSDTEVVLRGYLEFGSKLLSKLNGMFAFIVFDPRNDEIFFARDPLGIKPLYYTLNGAGIILGSELRAVSLLRGTEPQLSQEGVVQYVTQGYTLAPLTLIDGVFQVPHAHFGTWSKTKGLHLERFHDFSKSLHQCSRRSVSQEDALEELDALLTRVIRRQLLADVPVGCFLSGGIDSSLTTYYAKNAMSEELHTFTADFQEKDYSEGPLAARISNQLGTRHHSFTVHSNDLQSNWAQFAWETDAPLFDNSFLALSALSKETRKSVKVVLSGDGGDEAFLGYETYRADWLKKLADPLPQFTKKAAASLSNIVPTQFGKVTTTYKLHAFLRSFGKNSSQAHANWRSLASEEDSQALISEKNRDLFQEFHPERIYEKIYSRIEGADFLSSMSYLDFETWLPNDILIKSDRASMAHGLEARVPLLDIELVEFAMSLPDKIKFQPSSPKALLRKLLSKKIPSYPIHDKKKGFNVPMSEWICTSFQPTLTELLKSDSPLWSQLDRNRFEQMVQLHLEKKRDYGHLIWAVVVLNEWFSRLLQENSRLSRSE